MTYAEKLKSPKWQKKRLEILERDNFSCNACCDGEKTLHVHHKKYEKGKNPWDYSDENLITLCENCHNALHFFEKLDTTEKWILEFSNEIEWLHQSITTKLFAERMNFIPHTLKFVALYCIVWNDIDKLYDELFVRVNEILKDQNFCVQTIYLILKYSQNV